MKSLALRCQFISHHVWFQSHNDDELSSSSLWFFFLKFPEPQQRQAQLVVILDFVF
jgi:hypothetical protein